MEAGANASELTPCLALEAPGRCWLTCALQRIHVCRGLWAEECCWLLGWETQLW